MALISPARYAHEHVDIVKVPAPPLKGAIRNAAIALAKGHPLLIFDDPAREGETDIVFLAEKVTAEKVKFMRKEAGGLLCVTVPEELMSSMGIGFQQDMLGELSALHPILSKLVPTNLPYDRRSAFGLAINHRNTFTGVSDRDRALTIRAIGELVRDSAFTSKVDIADRFANEFIVPGHVPLLHAAKGLLAERRGHTELSTALANVARLTPSLALMEMLADDGGSLPVKEAIERARKKGWAFVDGKEIHDAWLQWFG
jgi:3,4-dihydroxy 2-butanone 4-phosphate synthase